MPDDLPVPLPRQDSRSEDVATVQWGSDEPARGGRAARILRGVGRDPRLAPVAAGAGVLAAIAAVTADWTITAIPNAGAEGGPVLLTSNVSDLGNFGAAYLIGTLAVLGCLSLALFGTAGVRHNARMAGVALAAGTLGVLIGVTVSLDDNAVTGLPYVPIAESLDISHGRGLVMAYVGTAAFLTALLLAVPYAPVPPVGGGAGAPAAGRPADPADPVATAPDPAAPVATAQTGPEPEPGAVPGWPWRRTRGGLPDPDDSSLPPPADLTVTPAQPFARPAAPFSRPDGTTPPNRRSGGEPPARDH